MQSRASRGRSDRCSTFSDISSCLSDVRCCCRLSFTRKCALVQERGKERRLSVGVPSPVSVEGFESGGLPGGLVDSDEDDVGESGSVSVAGPEKTELTVERAGDWDDWDDWDEEADDIDDLVRHNSQLAHTMPIVKHLRTIMTEA